MSDIERVIGEFADAWTAGRRPDVDDYLARVPEAERDELAFRIGIWLELAPTPDYDEPARAAIAREPVLRAALAAAEEERAPIAARLPVLLTNAAAASTFGPIEPAGRSICATCAGVVRRIGDCSGVPKPV